MNPEQSEQKLAELEALLFIYGEPLTRKKIQKILELEKADLDPLIEEFAKRLSAEGRGLALVNDAEKVQLATEPRFGKFLEDFVKSELSEELTPASLEVLSIISYLGPISRSQIEYRRGVNSSFTVRNLLLRGLIERVPDPKQPAMFLYQPSFELLKHLGVSKQSELPEYEKFISLLTVSDQESAAVETPERENSASPEAPTDHE